MEETISFEELLDRVFGKIGTPVRDQYEEEVKRDNLLEELVKVINNYKIIDTDNFVDGGLLDNDTNPMGLAELYEMDNFKAGCNPKCGRPGYSCSCKKK